MKYSVVEFTKLNYSDGTSQSKKEYLCSFSDKDEAETMISKQYWVMLGLGYSSVAVGSNVFSKEYYITKSDGYFPSSDRTIAVEEIVRYFVSETWDSME